jgi:hypothetical protein
MAKRHSPCGQLAHLKQVHGDWNMTYVLTSPGAGKMSEAVYLIQYISERLGSL